MDLLELYVGSEEEARSYRDRLRNVKSGLEKDTLVKVVSDSDFRLPAIRTSSNFYEGELSVGKLLAYIASR
jgi:hypothetical protein